MWRKGQLGWRGTSSDKLNKNDVKCMTTHSQRGTVVTKTICLRMEDETMEILQKAASHRKENISVFVRRAIFRELAQLGYLSPEETKALLWWQQKK